MDQNSMGPLDPDWIRNSDPDPEGQKLPTKIEKLINLIFLSAGCSDLRAKASPIA
jgi:hypothetical protein